MDGLEGRWGRRDVEAAKGSRGCKGNGSRAGCFEPEQREMHRLGSVKGGKESEGVGGVKGAVG